MFNFYGNCIKINYHVTEVTEQAMKVKNLLLTVNVIMLCKFTGSSSFSYRILPFNANNVERNVALTALRRAVFGNIPSFTGEGDYKLIVS